MSIDVIEPLPLDKARQVKYWKRCLKTLLPHHYTGNEGNRMYLGFFMLSALDLLDSLHDVTTEAERNDYINWIYRCQHPDGGFRMWPGTDFGELRNDENAQWDPANVPATFFALSALLVAGDDLSRVHRKKNLAWIYRMQRPDGSFGETIVEGRINGGMDPRFGYCATGIRHILRGNNHSGPLTVEGVAIDDIDIDKLVGCIRLAESYDGGIADYPYHEPHAGYEYCSLGALNFIGRLATPKSKGSGDIITGPSDPKATIRWLIERQTDLEDQEEELEFEDNEADGDHEPAAKRPRMEGAADSPITDPVHQSPDRSTGTTGFSLEPPDAGMNGRTGKVADTCYAWWAGASFHLLGEPRLYCQSRLRKYLLEKTQHPVLGGFGKFPGDLPDLYHSYLALAALGLDGVEGVLEVDPAMCISKRASGRLDTIWSGWKEE